MSSQEIIHILEIAKRIKNKDLKVEAKNKVLGLIFDKSSTRTRVSFKWQCLAWGTTIDLNKLPNW